jgi:hypothetical protein
MRTGTPFPLLIQRTQEALAAFGNQNYYVLLCGTQAVHKFRDTTFTHTLVEDLNRLCYYAVCLGTYVMRSLVICTPYPILCGW